MVTQLEIIFEYYEKHPDRPIKHPEVVDWATTEYTRRTGKIFRDPDRAIRELYSKNRLIKIQNGIYQYNPNWNIDTPDELFTPRQREAILKASGYKCSICGITKDEGADLQVDHIKPRSKGGKSIIENGQVLCSIHNYRKKNYGQTETGKNMFINMRRLAVKENDEILVKFIDDILCIYDKHGINSHIEWRDV